MNSKTVLQVEGMTCNSCANTVSRYLAKQGMSEVKVDFVSGEVSFKNGDDAPLESVVKGINGLGYKVTNEPAKALPRFGFTGLEKMFALCLLFTLPLLAHMFLSISILHNAWVQFGLCLPVMFMGLRQYGKSAWASLTMATPNMDVLILTGALAAFAYSIISLYTEGMYTHNVFFETSASIITFVTLGNIIEKRTVRQTRSAIDELKKLQPEEARKITNYGKSDEATVMLPVQSIVPMDYVLINEGEAISVDGKIKWGSALVDESMLTGESSLMSRSVNDMVFAGTTLVKGTVKVLTQKSADATVLSGIIELVKKAQSEKPSIQRIGDKVSAVFVPVVIVLALLVFLMANFVFHVEFKQALLSSIAVLVIACPCAMGLATPTAIAVGIGRAAKIGILFKTAQSLEVLAGARTIVFDKTGTLTTGKFSVDEIKIFNSNEEEVASIIAGLEKHSSHPIAKSLISYTKTKFPDLEAKSFGQVDEASGKGVIGVTANGIEYKIGSALFCEIAPIEGFHIYLTASHQLIAALKIKDLLSDNASEVIQYFRSAGLKTILLSGDSEAKCRIIQEQTRIGEVYAQQTPQMKFERIQLLKKLGPVVMVGDGINDAPSLAAADLGISVVNSSQVAINAAAVLLLHQDLASLKSAYWLSRQTITTIKQNIFWAIIYNLFTIPLAALGFIAPMWAVFSMAFSDFIVVGNSLRLKWKALK